MDYEKQQRDGHKAIEQKKQGCYYCYLFEGCHTAVWRNGKTCDLFNIDKDKIK